MSDSRQLFADRSLYEHHHKMIGARIDDMVDLINGQTSDGGNLRNGLINLVDILDQHFQFEERLMQSLYYPMVDEHVKHYASFRSELDFQIGVASPTCPDAAMNILSFIKLWSKNHDELYDNPLLDFLDWRIRLAHTTGEAPSVGIGS